MNIYLLVEGKTESKLFPRWLKHCAPHLERAWRPDQVAGSHYYLFNAGGYPSIIYNHLPNAVADVNDLGCFDYLVVCFDVDDETVAGRIEKTRTHLHERGIQSSVPLVFLLQECCIESWLLGNRKLYKRNPESERLQSFTRFYNVAELDPETMPAFDEQSERQQFHKTYFKALARERHLAYRENYPGQTGEREYWDQLVLRHEATGHLATFGAFSTFFRELAPANQIPG